MNRSFLLQALCFLLIFTLEVKLKASDEATLLQEPRNCLLSLASHPDCSVGVLHGQYLFEQEGLKVILPKSSILKKTASSWKLMTGAAAVLDMREPVQFQLGEIFKKSADRVSFYIEPVDMNFMSWRIIVTQGQLGVMAEGSKEISIEAGFEVIFKGLDHQGELITEIPQVLDIHHYARLWGALHQGTRNDYKKHLEQVREVQASAIEMSSQIYADVARRQIAAHDEAVARREKIRAQAQKEANELRELFIKRNFLDL